MRYQHTLRLSLVDSSRQLQSRASGCQRADSLANSILRDAPTGQSTQLDPVGLAGGLNSYGFAGGDPVNFADPFGLIPFVQCRAIESPFALGYTHCAVRVQNQKLGIDVMIEMIPDERNINRTHWRTGSDAANGVPGSSYDPDGWIEVELPEGMTEEAFDRAMLNSAAARDREFSGTRYGNDGAKNSNSFVYQTVKGAGSKPPKGAVKGSGSPGLCGGGGRATGTDCSPE